MKTNQVIECLKARRSCRAFSDRMPERELIEAVCEAGTYAPTGHGRQSPLIVAITNKGVRDRLSKMNARIWNELTLKRGGTPKPNVDPFYGAPVVLLVLADADVVTAEYDGCAVMTNLLNAAQSLGLASCWIHRAKEEFECEEGRQLLHELGIDGHYIGIDHCVLGYAAKDPAPAIPRKADYVRWVD